MVTKDVMFIGLSAYTLTTRKDFSLMGGFLMVEVVVAFVAGLGTMFFELPELSLAVCIAYGLG